MPYNQPGGTYNGGYGSAANKGSSGKTNASSGHQAAISLASKGAAPAAVTDYGAPIHTVPTGTYQGISAAKSPAAWAALNDEVNTYNAAATKWNAGTGPSLANFANAMAPMGLSMQPPVWGTRPTYTGGDYHLGLNPAALAGGLLGGAVVPGGGIPAGFAAGKLYDMAGGQNLMLGGPKAPESWSLNGPWGSPGQPTQGQGSSLGNPTGGGNGANHLNTLANINSNIPGNPGAPTISGTTQPPPTPTGPQYLERMANMQSIYPGYNVQLPSYKYLRRSA